MSGFFNILEDGTERPISIVLGDFNVGSPTDVIEHSTNEILFVPSESIPSGEGKATDIARLINSVSTTTMGTRAIPRVFGNVGALLQRTCTATASGNTVTVTQNVSVVTTITQGLVIGDASSSLTNGRIFTVDNLKYDCKRVNVIIDKEANQYHQDIDFRLTPQGNIQWGLSFHQPSNDNIYSVHYESVIQYRATSAMHINRFAQVPDRSTGLVAQVKMPEQWMLQKEFLIVRRDEYGNEIKKTGIFGDVIAAQPLNPAPSDSI